MPYVEKYDSYRNNTLSQIARRITYDRAESTIH